jgi:predicted CXXCH cytochrome family protein
MSNHFFEWQLSIHGERGVGCARCHGGNPSSPDKEKAHIGLLPSTSVAGRPGQDTVPETCGGCHRSIYNAFIDSTHYQRLKTSGLGPSCVTCHFGHMASSVRRLPPEGEVLCTYCHNAINGILPPRPEIPVKAKTSLLSIGRAQFTATAVTHLLAEAEKRKLDVSAEKAELNSIQQKLNEAKTGWHTFQLDLPESNANKAFEQGISLRDKLSRKLGG